MTRIRHADLPEDMPVHNNLVRTTYNNPDMHRGFASLSGRVHSASRLPGRLRELAILAVVGMLGASYEWQQHSRAAAAQGVTDDEMVALRTDDLSVFTPAEAAAIRFALAVERCRVDDHEWAAASAHYSPGELADLAMLAGFYGLASRFALAMDIDLEQEG